MLAQSQPYKSAFGLLWLRRPDAATNTRWAYCAEGSLGQYLVVVPDQELVALRMVRRRAGYNFATDGYEDFVQRVLGLVWS
ncbi:MAG: hypothetical protein MUD01_14165 [Chloroflexaceae bacterium]|jgi:hypothetical protein|nr:hypothetical protein [Chloroflexaceae bacterium]